MLFTSSKAFQVSFAVFLLACTVAATPATASENAFDAANVSSASSTADSDSYKKPLDAGNVIASWPMPSGIGAWGLGHDHTHLWVTSIALLGGDDSLTELTEGGTATGVSHALPWSSDPDWYADITYNKNTGRLWAMEVGGNNCIHEFHPSSGATGNKICPDWNISQRGLAHDPDTGNFFAGGWNESTIYVVDSAGQILHSKNVDLAIAGLAFNPHTRHLFVMTNASPDMIHVLDTSDSFAEVWHFNPGFGEDYAGSGMDMDCEDNLWALDHITQSIHRISTGRITKLCDSIFADSFETQP